MASTAGSPGKTQNSLGGTRSALGFTGPYQATQSRTETKVWLLTTRPGPGQYRTASSLGRQPDATKPTAPTVKFGKSLRPPAHRTPSQGPKYKTESSFGKQLGSKRSTAPSHGFGTSTRDGALKLYGVWSV